MAHRERLMTTDDVLAELELGDENDDLDEPMMPGSDDEFSDCDLDENDGDDNNDDSTWVPTSSQPQPGASSTPPSPPPSSPQWSSSWSSDLTLRYAPIADRISRDRFREISRYLHFVDNSTLQPKGSPGYDRLGKVRPVIDHLSKQFADLYEPHKEVAVDDAMIKFTGRSAVKQYMPMKPIKRGIKVWVLGDSHNGYFHTFQVYTGKKGSREKQLGQRVVKDLTRLLKGKNHQSSLTTSLRVSSCFRISLMMASLSVVLPGKNGRDFQQP